MGSKPSSGSSSSSSSSNKPSSGSSSSSSSNRLTKPSSVPSKLSDYLPKGSSNPKSFANGKNAPFIQSLSSNKDSNPNSYTWKPYRLNENKDEYEIDDLPPLSKHLQDNILTHQKRKIGSVSDSRFLDDDKDRTLENELKFRLEFTNDIFDPFYSRNYGPGSISVAFFRDYRCHVKKEKFCNFDFSSVKMGSWENWNGTWNHDNNSLTLGGGDVCDIGVERETTLRFKCGPKKEKFSLHDGFKGNVDDIIETSRCKYEILIETYYACEDSLTTTTTRPTEATKFYEIREDDDRFINQSSVFSELS